MTSPVKVTEPASFSPSGDSGVADAFAALTPEEREEQRLQWKDELAKIEDDIQLMRDTLMAKMQQAQAIKEKLGITPWTEFTEDVNKSLTAVKESQAYRKVNGTFSEFHHAVTSAPMLWRSEDWQRFVTSLGLPVTPVTLRLTSATTDPGMDGLGGNDVIEEEKPASLYQRTGAALKTTGEKASGLFAGLGAKFSEARESATFRSVEERVGSMVTTVKSKVGASGSSSTQSFDEALREAEAAKKQAEGVPPPAADAPQ